MPTDGPALDAGASPETAGKRRGATPFTPPLSISLPQVLEDGSDARFREFIWALLVVAARIHKFPEAFGRRIGISSAEYVVLIATAHIEGARGVGIRALADYLHLPAPHVTTTVGKLVAKGLLGKRPNPEDGRGVLVSLTAAGGAALERLAPFQREVNDVLFGDFDRAQFTALAELMEIFERSSDRALDTVAAFEREEKDARARTRRSAREQ
jgi:DNA-binding MarR family transcriptional regulator